VQGYGSLISTIYDNSTGTHPQAAVDPCRLADGTFVQLRLSAIAVSYAQLSHNVIVAVPSAPNCRSAAPSATTDRYFGQLLRVTTLSLHGRGARPVSSGPVYLSLLDAKGRRVGSVLHEPGANDMTFTFKGRIHEAAGFELTASKAVSVGDASSRRSRHEGHLQLNSPMQEALDSSLWRLTNTVGTFSVS